MSVTGISERGCHFTVWSTSTSERQVHLHLYNTHSDERQLFFTKYVQLSSNRTFLLENSIIYSDISFSKPLSSDTKYSDISFYISAAPYYSDMVFYSPPYSNIEYIENLIEEDIPYDTFGVYSSDRKFAFYNSIARYDIRRCSYRLLQSIDITCSYLPEPSIYTHISDIHAFGGSLASGLRTMRSCSFSAYSEKVVVTINPTANTHSFTIDTSNNSSWTSRVVPLEYLNQISLVDIADGATSGDIIYIYKRPGDTAYTKLNLTVRPHYSLKCSDYSTSDVTLGVSGYLIFTSGPVFMRFTPWLSNIDIGNLTEKDYFYENFLKNGYANVRIGGNDYTDFWTCKTMNFPSYSLIPFEVYLSDGMVDASVSLFELVWYFPEKRETEYSTLLTFSRF